MPLLVQICVVIATLAFLAIVATAILTLKRLGETAAQLTSEARESLTQVTRAAQETRDLVASVRDLMPPAQRFMKRFERLGERAADLSTAVLDEIEEPVVTAVAVARGVKIGAARLLNLLTRRFAQRGFSNNGERDHE